MLKALVVTMLGVAGLGSSFALADGGKHHDSNQGSTTSCQRTQLRGTASAPVSLTVTVQKANDSSSFAPGQVITVSLGSPGDTIRLEAGGCADGSTLTAREAELHVLHQHSTTAGETGTVTTTGNGHEDGHHGHGHDHGSGPGTTTGSTTTGSTTTDTTTTDSTTTSG